MQFHRESAIGLNMIRAIREDAIQVGEHWHSGNFIVAPDAIVPDWSPRNMALLDERHLEAVWSLEPELVLLGSGSTIEFPAPRVLAVGPARGIGMEVMDTAAACRTYNILASEGRKVAAALIITAR